MNRQEACVIVDKFITDNKLDYLLSTEESRRDVTRRQVTKTAHLRCGAFLDGLKGVEFVHHLMINNIKYSLLNLEILYREHNTYKS